MNAIPNNPLINQINPTKPPARAINISDNSTDPRAAFAAQMARVRAGNIAAPAAPITQPSNAAPTVQIAKNKLENIQSPKPAASADMAAAPKLGLVLDIRV